MPKLNTGEYFIRFYDRYGTPIKELDTVLPLGKMAADSFGYLQLDRYAKDLKDEPIPVSFTVDRRVHNSLDEKTRY